ncbi:prepilin-type N-terminal cleavage/methylation domain-containing protein [Candidatus Woesebacteria bacterium]|nr:prepilin-type N-terminal cleavage/methylation domain-containing protein [Candidatus Woesebacteria bacterium]
MKKKLLGFVKSFKFGPITGGFTMIELLIVIAILGILAVAVLAALNPIEQINRGRDTGSRSDSEQILSAIDRFNAFQGYYPWQTGATDVANMPLAWTSMTTAADVADTAATPCPISEKLSVAVVAGCIGTDELKVTFFERIFNASYNTLKIYNRGTQGDSTYVCFAPKSKAFVTEAAARVAGTLPADYPSEAYDPADGGSSTAADCGVDLNCICLP